MASLTAKVSLCAICSKATGNFTCRGCAQSFCTNHVIEHRQVLGKQMDEITQQHDQLRQNIAVNSEETCVHLLMRQIDEWEQLTIDKIRRIAVEYRNQLQNVVNKPRIKATEILESLRIAMNESREDDTFVETDLRIWKTKLEELERDLVIPPNIDIITDYNNALGTKGLLVIEISEDIFQNSFGNIKIEDNGKFISHGVISSYGAVRGKREYSSGEYQVRFKVEHLKNQTEIFFGIISKLTPMQSNASTALSAYGWAGGNIVFLNGVKREFSYNNPTNIENNDTFELLINCDKRKICLRKPRTNHAHELTIDIDKCPLPWQLSFGLKNWGDCVRLLSA